MPKIIKDNHDGSFTIYEEGEYYRRGSNPLVLVLTFVAIIGAFIYILFANLMNTQVISSFGKEQYLSNITHFFGGDRCVWVQGNSNNETQGNMNVYIRPTSSSEISHTIDYPVMVMYRGKDTTTELVVTDYSKREQDISWSAVTIYQEGGVIRGYLKRNLDSSVHERFHFKYHEKIDNLYSSDFSRHYGLDKRKIRGNRYSLMLNPFCEPRLVEN